MKFTRKSGLQGEAGPARPSEEPAFTRAEQTRAKPPGTAKAQRRGGKRGYLDGQMLIAMPTMGDERFARSVIYVCAHSSEGAMGIIVNHPAAHINFRDLLVQLDVVNDNDKIQLPQNAYRVKVMK